MNEKYGSTTSALFWLCAFVWLCVAYNYLPDSSYRIELRKHKYSIGEEFDIKSLRDAVVIADSLIKRVILFDQEKENVSIPEAAYLYASLHKMRRFAVPQSVEGIARHVKYLAYRSATGLTSGLRESVHLYPPESAKRIIAFRQTWQKALDTHQHDDFNNTSFLSFMTLIFRWYCVISVIGIIYLLLTHPCLTSTIFRKPHYLFFQILFWPLCLSKEMNPFEQLNNFKSTYRLLKEHAGDTVAPRIIERATWIRLDYPYDPSVAITLAQDRGFDVKKPLVAGLLVWMLSISIVSIRSHHTIPVLSQVVSSLCIDTLLENTQHERILLDWFLPITSCLLVVVCCIQTIIFHVLTLCSMFYGYSFLVRGPPAAAIAYQYYDMPLVATSE